MISWEEIERHASRDSCWIVVNGKIYDVTNFIDEHPGGAKSLLRYGGKDGTEEYNLLHAAGTVENTLPLSQQLGLVDPNTFPSVIKAQDKEVSSKSKRTPISFCVNLNDIENVARQVMSKKAWVYFHSAADSLESLNSNLEDWKKISFRPRILRNVARVNMARKILGHRSKLPFFIAPAALAKLGNEDGELCLARGAALRDIPYCISSYSSVAHEDVAECMRQGTGGSLFFQLYVSRSKDRTLELIDLAKSLGCKALVITVDTPVIGKREEDERYKAEVEYEDGEVPTIDARFLDGAKDVEMPILRGVHSSTLDWEDLKWIRQAWAGTGPMVLKGIQTVEDAKQAADIGIEAIYLSNHGGRQLDCAPSSIRTLLEIRRFCPEILTKVEIYLDGGVRRGTDILKALCLGATAVSLGRPFMYGLGAYGTEGVLKIIQLLSDEIETSMRLLGVTSLDQLNPDMVNCTLLERDLPVGLTAFEPRTRSKL